MQRIASPNTWTWALALLACLGMSMGQLPAWALGQPQESNRQTTASPEATVINDVALDDSGQLVGRVVDAQGQPRDGVLVVLRQGHREVARTTTDARGQFTLANIPGGLYQLDAGSTRAVYRIWDAQLAPPQTRPLAVLVSDATTVVRGHHIEAAVDQLDVVTLAMVSTAIAGVSIAAISLDEIHDLQDTVDSLITDGLPVSP